jgi:hypothetical protein
VPASSSKKLLHKYRTIWKAPIVIFKNAAYLSSRQLRFANNNLKLGRKSTRLRKATSTTCSLLLFLRLFTVPRNRRLPFQRPLKPSTTLLLHPRPHSATNALLSPLGTSLKKRDPLMLKEAEFHHISPKMAAVNCITAQQSAQMTTSWNVRH